MPTFTDAGDGSGVVVNNTAGAADLGLAFYRGDGSIGAVPPVASVVLAGGVRTVLLAKGFWFCTYYDPLAASPGAAPPMAVVQVTDGREALASQIRDALASRIGLLNLPNCQEIAIQMTPDETNLTYPCVVITPHDLQETDEQALSTLDDRGHPNRVMICFREDAIDHAVLKLTDFWRERIVRALHNQQMPNPREVVRMRVEFDFILNPNLPQYQYMVSEFVVRVTTREPRGVGA